MTHLYHDIHVRFLYVCLHFSYCLVYRSFDNNVSYHRPHYNLFYVYDHVRFAYIAYHADTTAARHAQSTRLVHLYSSLQQHSHYYYCYYCCCCFVHDQDAERVHLLQHCLYLSLQQCYNQILIKIPSIVLDVIERWFCINIYQ